MKNPINILYVTEDDESFDNINNILKESERFTHNIEKIKNKEDINQFFFKEHDFCFIDQHIEKNDGFELVKNINLLGYNKPIFMFSRKIYKSNDFQAFELGILGFFVKESLFQDSNACPRLERNIFLATEIKKVEKRLKASNEIKDILLNSTFSGICMVDLGTGKFIEANNSFFEMFNIEQENLINTKFNDFFEIKKYSKSIYNNNLDGDFCAGNNCPCERKPLEAKVVTITGIVLDCLIECRKISIKNGITKTIRLLTFVNISKQKKIEKKLIKSQEELQNIIRKYGLEEKNPEAILSLVDLEIEKFVNNEEMAQWET